MNYLKYTLILFSISAFAQYPEIKSDTLAYEYYYVKGDSIPVSEIVLDEVMLLHKLKFDSREERKRYLILKRKTLKVYHYARLASERLDTLNARLERMVKKRERKRYAKKIQTYLEGEFTDELKKLTRTEGQILIKLIHRQTGKTTYELVKELRNGWRAFWFNSTANVFDISLKRKYDPMHVKEDYLIEDILQRNFQSGRLERQKDALGLDFYVLTDAWRHSSNSKVHKK
ncbi:MAG: DUF4294 domain-containing protein [Flavobacteriaceae bacterium]|nr:DUF4294 domain-containing protein [Flavobacteriaceae bacterium]